MSAMLTGGNGREDITSKMITSCVMVATSIATTRKDETSVVGGTVKLATTTMLVGVVSVKLNTGQMTITTVMRTTNHLSLTTPTSHARYSTERTITRKSVYFSGWNSKSNRSEEIERTTLVS